MGMDKAQSISLAPVKGNEREYIIKDSVGITRGRFFIIELSKENRFCSFRVKFYRNDEDNYKILKDALKLILAILFKNMDIFKVSALINEDACTRAFTELGYELEGIVTNSIIGDKHYKHELMFGIDKETYEAGIRKRNVLLKGRRIELRLLTPENSTELLEYYKRNREHLRQYEPSRDESFYTLEVSKWTLCQFRYF